MKKIYVYSCLLMLLLCVGLLSACQKNDLVLIEGMEEWLIRDACFELSTSQLIVQDSTDLVEQVVAYRKNKNGCRAYLPPFIDFGQHTLLGLQTSVEACMVSITKEVFANTEDKVYWYHITAILSESEGCEVEYFEAINWVLVPKLPDNFRVDFEVSYLKSP